MDDIILTKEREWENIKDNSANIRSIFTVVKSAQDGNCLYSSVFASLNEEELEKYPTIQKLRIATKCIIKQNIHQIKNDIQSKYKNEEELSKYIENISKNGNWATDFEIAALAILLGKTIFNICSNDNKNCNSIQMYCYDNDIHIAYAEDFQNLNDIRNEDTIFILWNGTNHWDSLKIKNK